MERSEAGEQMERSEAGEQMERSEAGEYSARAASRPRAVQGVDGMFRDPWDDPSERRGLRDFLRWRIQRLRTPLEPDPPANDLTGATPAIVDVAQDEIRLTWVGHATFLLQLPGVNVLTDPVWSRRVSPVAWAGPARIRPPGLDFDALPPIDVVLLSHDHYDHLDRPTVKRLHARFGERITWIAPTGHSDWLRRRGVRKALDLDWWQSASVTTSTGRLGVSLLPARHWSRRGPGGNRRLWGSFFLTAGDARVYYAGDSAYAPFYDHIRDAHAPFHATLFPIGAYEPRWFMQPAHMSPEEAVQAWLDLGGTGVFAGMHWGTFRLSDEPPLEPPSRIRAAWAAAGLPPDRLWIPRHGETRVIRVERGNGR